MNIFQAYINNKIKELCILDKTFLYFKINLKILNEKDITLKYSINN